MVGTAPDTHSAAHVDLLVVGGGPAGHAAATAYRDHGGQGTVVLVSADETPPYDRPPLSKDFLRGETDEAELALAAPARYAAQGIALWSGCSVTVLDMANRTAALDTGEQLTYSACVLATGATPAPLPVPVLDGARPHHLRSLRDAHGLRAAAAGASSAVVIGSGFIGCEAASSLARLGLRVTMVSREALPQQARLGDDVAGRIAGWLTEDGVTLIGDVEVAALAAGAVELVDHAAVAGELVLVATGVVPLTGLAAAAGARTEHDLVVVDEGMRTSLPGLYAAGDITFARNATGERHLAVEHWGEALAMGEIAGANAAGADLRWAQVPGFWTTIGDHTLKYAAWGDGHDDVRVDDHGDGAFTAWYSTDGVVVGVATHDADDDYERGRALVEGRATVATAAAG